LADPLHNARKLKIQSVAGPEYTDQIGASVHNSAMESGEPIPEPRRDMINPGFNPSFDHQKQASTNPSDSGHAAEKESAAKGAAKNAKEAAEKANKDAADAKNKAFDEEQKA